MLDRDLPREPGEPHNEHDVRCVRAARIEQMRAVRSSLARLRTWEMTTDADDQLCNAIEELAEIVDDIIERRFV